MIKTRKTAIAVAAAQFALIASGAAFAQTAPAGETTTVVVVGQRGALESAQNIKKNSDEIVDSVVADDIGKLPDKSVTEVLQRIVGVSIDRTLNRADPQQTVGDGIAHFAAEGTGVSIRGLGAGQVRSEFNGRDAFSANGGRALSFEDVPPELMAGVDVYKNPSAEQIEGGIAGLVNLRTALPFDSKGRKFALSSEVSGSSLRKKSSPPSASALYSDRWDTRYGQVGVLIDLAHSKITSQSDSLSITPYVSRTNLAQAPGQMRWIPSGAGYGQNTFERTRDGLYGALQWKKGDFMSYVTYLSSKYKMHTGENSYFASSDPSTITLDPGATFDSHGAFVSGTLRDPINSGTGFAPGLSFGTDARSAGRDARTRDVSWSGTWRANDSWTLKFDLQHTKASTDGYDNTVGIGGWVPSLGMDLTGDLPKFTFDQQAKNFLVNPNNYYWGFTQQHHDVATARMNAARVDAKYTFDNPVLNDLRFGLRLTERSTLTQSTHDSEWSQISQGWSVGSASWQPLTKFAALSDPRFSSGVETHNFNNFFGGSTPAPAPVIVPNMATADSLAAIANLHSYYTTLCKEANATAGRNNDCSWNPPPFGDKTGLNEQHERTSAFYAQLRFGFDKLPYPVDGNVGLRAVRTNPISVGYTFFDPPKKPLVPGVPDIPAYSQKQNFENAYTRYLPSLNLRMKVNDELQFRAAFARAMARPDFYLLQAYTSLGMTVHTVTPAGSDTPVLQSIDYTGTLRGNTFLKPVMSTNMDLTAEYYFGKASSATLGVFNKRLKDIIISQTAVYPLPDVNGKIYNFLATGPTNGMDAKVSGLEASFQMYFDKLPGVFSGLGVSTNATLLHSTTSYHDPVNSQWCTPKGTLFAQTVRNLQGCDTDGSVFGNMPMTGLSKKSANVALLYDKGELSMRLAYSWRDKYLQSTNAYGTAGGEGIDRNPASPNQGNSYSVDYGLPTWGGAYGQLDFGLQYKIGEHIRVGGQIGNLTNQIYKQYMQQHIGMKLRSEFYTGRSYGAQLNYTF